MHSPPGRLCVANNREKFMSPQRIAISPQHGQSAGGAGLGLAAGTTITLLPSPTGAPPRHRERPSPWAAEGSECLAVAGLWPHTPQRDTGTGIFRDV